MMLGCLMRFKISISLVTRCTSASSTIFFFSSILMATFMNKVMNQFTYLFSSENMRTKFDFTKGTFTDIFADNVMSNASLSAFFVIDRWWLRYIR
jgi:hypothetical protein